MKPRGEAVGNFNELRAEMSQERQDRVREKVDAELAKMDAEAPTAEGQAESIIQPVLERQEGEQGGIHLEADSVQNLDSAETPQEDSSVAPSKELAEILAQSKAIIPPHSAEATGATVYDFQGDPVKITVNTSVQPEKCCDRDYDGDGNCDIHSAPGIFRITETTLLPEAQLAKMAGQMLREVQQEPLAVDPVNRALIHTLGEQPNGDYKTVVTINEGYIEAVRQWAEADKKTVEEWLSDFITAYLESYGSPARSR